MIQCISSGSGPTRIGDEIKPQKDTKVTKLLIFKTPQNTYKEAKLQNLKTFKSVFPQALLMRGLKKVYFRTLELLGGFEEIPLLLIPCDEIKPTFLSLIRHFFEETGWPKALPHIFV